MVAEPGVAAGLRRRWYVVTVGTAVSIALCLFAFTAVSPTFTATTIVLVLPPAANYTGTDPTAPQFRNPYLNFQATVRITADILARSVSDQETAKKLSEQGAQGTYTVALSDSSSTGAPVVLISAVAPRPAAATGTADLVRGALGARLDEMQRSSGAPQDQWLRLQVLATSAPSRQMKRPLQAAAGALAFGLFLTLVAALALDRLLQSGGPRPPSHSAPRSRARYHDTSSTPYDLDNDRDATFVMSRPHTSTVPGPAGDRGPIGAG